MKFGSRLGRREVIAILFVLAGLAAVTTAIITSSVAPHGTVDLDEVAYESQANALAHHELTLPASTHDPFFRPFLSGVRGNRVVFKYQPEWPALLAASNGLFGSTVPLRMLLSVAGVLAVAWFAWELVRDGRVALIAAALVVASPFSWVQTASLLGYQLSFVLGTAAAAAFVRAVRTSATTDGLAAGALLGMAVFHRPFDALLATAPVLAYWGWCTWRRGEVRRRVLPVVIGGVPFAAVFFAYNQSVMGAVTHLAYNVTGPSDRFGFGWRASFTVAASGNDGRVHYTLARAYSSLGHLGVVLPRFVAFAPVFAVLAGLCIWSRRRDARLWLLVAMVAVVVAGYFFWWGVSNSYHFELDRSLGPFYYYPVLAPLCVLAAWGAVLVRWRSVVLVTLATAAGLTWAGIASAIVVRDARNAGRARTTELAALRVTPPALVLEAPQFRGDPYLRVATDAALHSARLVAVDVPGRRLELLDRFPGRTPYLDRSDQPFGDSFGPAQHDRVALRVLHARVIAARVDIRLDADQSGTVYLRIGNAPPQAIASGRGVFSASVPLRATSLPDGTQDTTVAFGVVVAAPGAPAPHDFGGEWFECATEARAASGGEIDGLEPCDGHHHYVFPGGASAVTDEDVSSLLQVELRPG